MIRVYIICFVSYQKNIVHMIVRVNLIHSKLVFFFKKNITKNKHIEKKKWIALFIVMSEQCKWIALFTETRFEENFTGCNADAGKAAWSCFQRNADASTKIDRSH